MWWEIREMKEISKITTLAIAVAVPGACWLLRYRSKLREAQRNRERRLYEEMRLYSRLDLRSANLNDRTRLAAIVCDAIAHAGAFRRVAVLLSDGTGGLQIAGESGLEVRTRLTIESWCTRLGTDALRNGARIRREDRCLGQPRLGRPLTDASFAVKLAERPGMLGYEQAIVTPMWTLSGRLEGAILMCADSLDDIRPSMIEDALTPIETLALKVGRSLENAALAESLMRADRLARVGVVAGGMAHALNNPLTAVVGFAELIAETSVEPRAREDAKVILREALRMRETVESVLEFGHPATDFDETVSLTEMTRLLATECAGKLAKRGVELIVQAAGEEPWVFGSKPRIREMLEHLLNHASHVVAGAELEGAGHTIRISVGRQAGQVHLVVSDTVSRFHDPAAMFDIYGIAGESLGLDLALCYRIVRSIGGEMRAFNMHPCGAAVAVELRAADLPKEAHTFSRQAAKEILSQ